MFSAQKTRSGVPTEQQSVLPTVRGVPWWGAVLIALVPTVIGAVIDASGKDELATTYRVLYFIGCVAAVLMVRRRSLFTAITQPPLIAFGVALVALYLLKSGSETGLKNLIINVLLPIAKTFPLMAWTFIAVLLLGLGRWFLTRKAAEDAPKRSARRRDPDRSVAAGRPRAEERAGSRTRTARRDAKPDTDADRPRRREAPTRHSTGRDGAARSPRRSQDEPTRVTPPTRRRVDNPPGRDRDREQLRSPIPRDESLREPRPRPAGHRRPNDPPVADPGGRDLPPMRRSPGRPRAESGLDELRPPSAPRARYRGVNP